MNNPLNQLAARVARPTLPRRTVRLRLTAIYGGLFLLSGGVLLTITYVLVAGFPSQLVGSPPKGAPPGGPYNPFVIAAKVSAAQLHDLLVRSGIALGIMAVISLWLGWLVAGRALKPLRVITAATKAISEDNLHRRLALQGPDDEIKDLADTIDGLLTRLEGAFDAQRNFVANASHELRTPLTLAQALLQMSLRDPHTTAASFRSTCEEVLTAGQQQEKLIESLLVLARSQRGLDHHEPVDLAAIAADTAEAHQAAADAQGLHIEVSAQPAIASGDTNLIDRLVTNLVENAIRYNTPGGHVHVLVQRHDGHATLRVDNTGPQIRQDDVARLLQPFQRATTSRIGDPEGLGLGLGLSIVAAIAHAHHATLSARAKPHGGLDICVRFPPPATASNYRGIHQVEEDALLAQPPELLKQTSWRSHLNESRGATSASLRAATPAAARPAAARPQAGLTVEINVPPSSHGDNAVRNWSETHHPHQASANAEREASKYGPTGHQSLINARPGTAPKAGG
jgi:signal transduction histidine kinase